MGIMDLVRARLTPSVLTPRVTTVGSSWGEWWEEVTADIHDASPAKLFRTQPHLYTVVSFLARNIAQLGLHTFERVSETDRRRDRVSPAAQSLAGVDGTMTTYELIYATVGDVALYDRAFWFVGPDADLPSGFMLRRIPPTWVSPDDATPFQVKTWQVSFGDQIVKVPASQILAFTGYSPTNPLRGSPAVEALRGTLQEQVEAASYRKDVWKRGGRVSAVLERPKDAPQWTAEQMDRFREDWYAKYTGRGSRAGGTPILEDGMKLTRIDFNAQEQQFVEAAKLSLVTVASAFHINPTMIGQNDGANYSNVREFRKMLYGDTLGPILAQIEQRLNTFLLPMLGVDPSRFYVEFNIAEKLQGNFEEQAAAIQTSTGAPWMTRAEARARMNLPAIPDADGLVVPLNVLIGGQASPNDSGSQNRNSGMPTGTKAIPAAKARADSWQGKAEKVLRDFYVRQERSVRSAMGSKAADWWDTERWDSELSDDLFRLAASIAGEIGPKQAQDLGFKPGDFDTARTLKFLRAVADRRAQDMNAATLAQLESALQADDPATAVDSVWTVAQESRSASSGSALVTFASAFAVGEAAHQLIADKATKTWIAGPNPRPSHAAMSGETVPLDEPFSNGMMRPGDSTDVDQVAGCNCSISVQRG